MKTEGLNFCDYIKTLSEPTDIDSFIRLIFDHIELEAKCGYTYLYVTVHTLRSTNEIDCHIEKTFFNSKIVQKILNGRKASDFVKIIFDKCKEAGFRVKLAIDSNSYQLSEIINIGWEK